MKKIPIHMILEKFHGEIAFLRYVSENKSVPVINYAQRDDYYMFIFVEKGQCKLILDFEEYELTENMVFCILPGQVHFPV